MFNEILVFDNGNKYKQVFKENIINIPQIGNGILLECMEEMVIVEKITLDYKNKRIVINNV